MPNLIEMNRIKKSFAGVAALQSANLNVTPGEVHAIIGQNGAGKSTLIKILTGVYRKDDGEVKINGNVAVISTPREAQDAGIATIYQELSLVPLRSVTENVMMGYEPRTRLGLINWTAAHKRTQEILTRFGIDIDVRAQLGSYSTAIQQLVAIARAVSMNAQLVIMDEATSSLDDQEIEILFGVVRELKKEGVAVLYISHFLDELYQICDRVTIMRDGQTVAQHVISETTKLGLISEMLGRDPEEIKAAGMTGLGGNSKAPGEVLLQAKSIETGRGLKDVSVAIRKGEIVGLGGLLGSGRTEAARALFGLDTLRSGSIARGGGKSAFKTPAEAIAEGVGFLTEDRKREGIIPHMSVRENMTLALLPQLKKMGHVDRKRETELVEGFIKSLGIKTAGMEQPIRELSGGNQQKVLLARWLALEPDILILDEPTRGVDVGAKLEIQSIIREYVDKGLGILLISSEFEELVEGADRIVVLQDGYSVSELQNPGVTEESLIAAIAHHHERTA
ncbi:sugar ABC transporter ATP-binding protein [Amylibacter marinus]|uniref:Sugar ABC transporter ATP-binding protein n=1 Tax=Amylibacter marinus TaxID=1475483 RepID=A0ABQ5VYC2_9RHOB|nr:sugar ABC transporter ATP-binding protein [Amylibacter marinus]GLQ36197.1 sugar ABC transporter ATP-binding protein [Amylibacter marinus]